MKTSTKMLSFGVVAVVALWVTYAFIRFGRPVGTWGQFGDKFGALNTLFTGLAFVGLLATLWHEREKSEDAERDHERLLAAMAKQTRAALHNAEVQGTIALLNTWNGRHASAIQEREAQLSRNPAVVATRQWEGTCWDAAQEYAKKLEALIAVAKEN